MQISVFNALFNYRQIFLSLASHDTSFSAETHIVASWVDVLLASIGDAIMIIIGWKGKSALSATSKSLFNHVSESTLHAALQLPGK